jgi:hypothetical protein
VKKKQTYSMACSVAFPKNHVEECPEVENGHKRIYILQKC